jgi:hypothetical protein
MNVPDLIEPVLGYRVWRVRDGLLHPWCQHGPWLPGEPEPARCLSTGTTHAAPASGCHCGFHALNSLDAKLGSYSVRDYATSADGRHMGVFGRVQGWVGWVAGAVVAWGRLEVHANSFRAEYAKPVAVIRGPNERMCHEVARRYSCALVPIEDVEAIARRYGSGVPTALRPAPENSRSAGTDADLSEEFRLLRDDES